MKLLLYHLNNNDNKYDIKNTNTTTNDSNEMMTPFLALYTAFSPLPYGEYGE